MLHELLGEIAVESFAAAHDLVLVHELTHALQDQHFDLERWLSELSPTEDGVLARANCLVVVPEVVTDLPAGADVDVVLIEGALQ